MQASLTSKLVFGGSVAFTVSIVTYVHMKQKQDRENLRKGVVRDIQRQEMKKRKNIKDLQDQIELTKVLEANRREEAKRVADGR